MESNMLQIYDIDYIQNKIIEIYKANKAVIEYTDMNNILKNEEEQSNITYNIGIIDCALMESEYMGYNKDYYNNFANDCEENTLLKESDYVMFNLGKYYVDTVNCNRIRHWIYESELHKLKIKLLQNKKTLQDILVNTQVIIGITIANMR